LTAPKARPPAATAERRMREVAVFEEWISASIRGISEEVP
jgi:hypothetical protein